MSVNKKDKIFLLFQLVAGNIDKSFCWFPKVPRSLTLRSEVRENLSPSSNTNDSINEQESPISPT